MVLLLRLKNDELAVISFAKRSMGKTEKATAGTTPADRRMPGFIFVGAIASDRESMNHNIAGKYLALLLGLQLRDSP